LNSVNIPLSKSLQAQRLAELLLAELMARAFVGSAEDETQQAYNDSLINTAIAVATRFYERYDQIEEEGLKSEAE